MSHTKLGLQVIVARKQCFRMHCELRDYSLGQIAFTVFQVLFAHTAALPHKHIVNKRL